MTRWIALPAAFVAAALTMNIEAAAKTNPKPSSPKTTAKSTAPKTTTKAPSTKGPSTKSTSAKTNQGAAKAKAPKSTTTTAKGNGSSKKTAPTTTASATSTTTTPTTEWTPTNAVSEKVMSKPNQLARLKSVLPAGTDLNDATAGFKNFGQLNAAVNASRNLGIDFADLKAAMTGTTLAGEPTNQRTLSLGQAIQQYKPGVDGDSEAATATAQAARDGGQ